MCLATFDFFSIALYSYVFPCNKWLSKSEDDGQLVRELVCQQEDVKGYSTQYRITTVTTETVGADAGVS